MPPTKVVLDANVLVPITLVDTLLRCAQVGLYKPAWSDAILDEAIGATLKIFQNAGEERIRRRFGIMNSVFPHASITPSKSIAKHLGLPDDGDEHVVQTAIQAKALIITTNNTKNFPTETLSPLHISVLSADEFLCHLLELEPKIIHHIISQQSRDKVNPRVTVSELLMKLEKESVPHFARNFKNLFLL